MNFKAKTEGELRVMSEGGKILGEILHYLCGKVQPGVKLIELDRLAEGKIKKAGGDPSFKMVPGYRHCICTTVNDDVVHGIPNDYALKDGDIVGVDIGIYWKGLHTDTSATVAVGNITKEKQMFLEAGKLSLREAIEKAAAGNRVWDISNAMQRAIKAAGYSPVRSLTGHGIGRNLHEDPAIPCYTVGKRDKSPVLIERMTIAIETIYNMGSWELIYKNDDDWTISTRDKSLSASFEVTVAVGKDKATILTPHFELE